MSDILHFTLFEARFKKKTLISAFELCSGAYLLENSLILMEEEIVLFIFVRRLPELCSF